MPLIKWPFKKSSETPVLVDLKTPENEAKYYSAALSMLHKKYPALGPGKVWEEGLGDQYGENGFVHGYVNPTSGKIQGLVTGLLLPGYDGKLRTAAMTYFIEKGNDATRGAQMAAQGIEAFYIEVAEPARKKEEADLSAQLKFEREVLTAIGANRVPFIEYRQPVGKDGGPSIQGLELQAVFSNSKMPSTYRASTTLTHLTAMIETYDPDFMKDLSMPNDNRGIYNGYKHVLLSTAGNAMAWLAWGMPNPRYNPKDDFEY